MQQWNRLYQGVGANTTYDRMPVVHIYVLQHYPLSHNVPKYTVPRTYAKYNKTQRNTECASIVP
jgi:hypothetical protein